MKNKKDATHKIKLVFLEVMRRERKEESRKFINKHKDLQLLEIENCDFWIKIN